MTTCVHLTFVTGRRTLRHTVCACCRAPDPATSAIVQTLSGHTPGAPPGAHFVRTSGSHEPVPPLHYDPVGPWGETAYLHPCLQCLSCCHCSLLSSLACACACRIYKHSCCSWKCCPRQRASMHIPTCPVHVAAGVTPGPGRGPSDFEHMQRRHRGAVAFALACHRPAICPPALTQRVFTKRVEVCMPPWSISRKPCSH